MNDNMFAIDTLSIYERLKKTKNTDSLAHEIAEIFKEVTEDKLATKADMKMLQADLQHTEIRLQADLKQTELKLQKEISQSKVDMIRWVAGMLLAQAGLITTLNKLL
jgi:hypothetical protein